MTRGSVVSEPRFNASIPGADDLIRLHLSESPHGASPLAMAAAERELRKVSLYPSPEREELTELLALRYGVASEQVVVANGSDELVLATTLSSGSRARRGLVFGGTFPGYAAALDRAGRGFTSLALDGPAMDVAEFAARLPGHGIGYVCNPHNPSGSALSASEIAVLVDAARSSGVPLVFDEAYMEFADPGTPGAIEHVGTAPVIVLRTFSKAYGLAALRVGYAIGPAELIGELRAALRVLPFSVNRVAQAAASAALGDHGYLERTRQANAATRAWFEAQLWARGRHYLPSTTNFVAVASADPALAQDALATEYGILVRSAALFGFAGYLRISLGSRSDLSRLLCALDEIEPTALRVAERAPSAAG